MQIVIDIPEEEYQNYLKMRPAYPKGVFCYIEAIQNGTPLPEHHGRIIDESQIKHIACHTERELYGDKIRYVKATDTPTIIEGSDKCGNGI